MPLAIAIVIGIAIAIAIALPLLRALCIFAFFALNASNAKPPEYRLRKEAKTAKKNAECRMQN